MNTHFDLVVIGTGSAGATIAHRCRAAGWEVAIIDSKPFGGTCALRGCDPKKVLVGLAELAYGTERMQNAGAVTRASDIEWPGLMRFKRTFTEPVPVRQEKSLSEAGIAAFHGRCGFLGPTTLQVADQTLSARHFAIAAGATPVQLAIPGEEHLTTSEQFLELANLPGRIVFVGGGYISFEFAYIARVAGAQVSMIHRGERPLQGFDSDLVNNVVSAARELGINVFLGAPVEALEKSGDVLLARTRDQTFEADLVVHGAGRVADILDMDLERAGVEYTRKGVTVNEYLQSVSNPAVYAAGDAAATAGLPLTPVAGAEGAVVASNLLHGNHLKPDYAGVPTVVFTLPPLAAVGLREEEAQKRGLRFKTKAGDTSSWYSSRRIGLKHSGFKVLIEEDTDRILGAHLFGPHADEAINLFAQAIRFHLTATDLRHTMYAYPTSSSDIAYMV